LPAIIHYLYARSFFEDNYNEIGIKKVISFWKNEILKNRNKLNPYLTGMFALVLNRINEKELARNFVKSIYENSIIDEETGMHFNQKRSWCWYEMPIETQTLLIEAVNEVTNDTPKLI